MSTSGFELETARRRTLRTLSLAGSGIVVGEVRPRHAHRDRAVSRSFGLRRARRRITAGEFQLSKELRLQPLHATSVSLDPGSVARRTRRTDPEWKERIIAATEGRAVSLTTETIEPYVRQLHRAPLGFMVALEVRPRAGSWHPFAVAIPHAEVEAVGLQVRSGPRGMLPAIAGVVFSRGEATSDDGLWHIEQGWDPATPTNSNIFLKKLPTKLSFGQLNTPDQMYIWDSASN